MSEPKSIHDGLRRLQTLVSAVEMDVANYLDRPQDYTAEYFEDVLTAVQESIDLVVYVRSELKGEVNERD